MACHKSINMGSVSSDQGVDTNIIVHGKSDNINDDIFISICDQENHEIITCASCHPITNVLILCSGAGSLMTLAWILFASVGLFTARYMRVVWEPKQLLGTKAWFTVGVTSTKLIDKN